MGQTPRMNAGITKTIKKPDPDQEKAHQQ